MARFFDILLSALALIALSPILIPVAIVLKFTGEGEIFFRQTRIGRNQNEFQLIKFATMLKDSPNIGTGVMTVKDDPRVLPLGGILRKTKINELPQLLNVFAGQMSLIGPRPQAEKVFSYYPEHLQPLVSSVPPGLSGIGSILFRDEESIIDQASDKEMFYSRTISPYKAEVEAWFAQNRTLKLYFLLIFLTIWVVVVPTSKLPWRILPDLPKPPSALALAMNLAS